MSDKLYESDMFWRFDADCVTIGLLGDSVPGRTVMFKAKPLRHIKLLLLLIQAGDSGVSIDEWAKSWAAKSAEKLSSQKQRVAIRFHRALADLRRQLEQLVHEATILRRGTDLVIYSGGRYRLNGKFSVSAKFEKLVRAKCAVKARGRKDMLPVGKTEEQAEAEAKRFLTERPVTGSSRSGKAEETLPELTLDADGKPAIPQGWYRLEDDELLREGDIWPATGLDGLASNWETTHNHLVAGGAQADICRPYCRKLPVCQDVSASLAVDKHKRVGEDDPVLASSRFDLPDNKCIYRDGVLQIPPGWAVVVPEDPVQEGDRFACSGEVWHRATAIGATGHRKVATTYIRPVQPTAPSADISRLVQHLRLECSLLAKDGLLFTGGEDDPETLVDVLVSTVRGAARHARDKSPEVKAVGGSSLAAATHAYLEARQRLLDACSENGMRMQVPGAIDYVIVGDVRKLDDDRAALHARMATLLGLEPARK